MKKIKEWWQKRKKKKLMNKFLGALPNEDNQRKILRQLINSCDISNQDLWLLSRGVRAKSVLSELHRLILFNQPTEGDLFHLIIASNDDLIAERALKKMNKKYGLNKSAMFILLKSAVNNKIAWDIFDKLEILGLNDNELFYLVRTVKIEPMADYCFELLLKNYGVKTTGGAKSGILN